MRRRPWIWSWAWPWVLAALALIGQAQGHPLGNNTVSRAADIQVGTQGMDLVYRLDLAEIPSLLAAAEADWDGDGLTSEAEWEALARGRGEAVRTGLDLRADGVPLDLTLERVGWRLTPGAAGLTTLRIDLELYAAWPGQAPGVIDYRDPRRPQEAGWKEVAARAGPGVRLAASDVPDASPSQGLTAYPAPGGLVLEVLTARLGVAVWPATRASAVTAGPLPAAPPGAWEGRPGRTVAPASAAPGAALPQDAQTPRAPPAAQPAAFFRLGIAHIANGLDHLVFLLGLISGERSLRRLAWVVTAFTAAHTVALGLAASGLIVPPGAWIEPAIGLTILYVGLANLCGGLRHGAGVAFGFGLVHGFAFAGALAAHLSAGPGPAWLLDLAAFNLGVEAGQVALVLLVLLLVRAGRQLGVTWPPWARWLPGGLVGSLGAYWTIQRTSILLGVSR